MRLAALILIAQARADPRASRFRIALPVVYYDVFYSIVYMHPSPFLVSGRIVGGGGYRHMFEKIISIENLLDAWEEFICGKRWKYDVQIFSANLMENILTLHTLLATYAYYHGSYQKFRISDPKPRDISKASVRDRLLHHAIHRILYPFFDKKFIADSFSCRLKKGTHKAIGRFRSFAYQVSRNNTRTCWVLKCDIRKFFASIDHQILMGVLSKYIQDTNTAWLLGRVIDSFSSSRMGIGLPLGNLTSQLFVNIYMNEFDQFVKHKLKVKYYLRYADDFVVFSHDKDWLAELLPRIGNFLQKRLNLDLHPNKVSIKTIASGIDFLGWVHFTDHRVLRTVTKRRMFAKIKKNPTDVTLASYLGMLRWGNTEKLIQAVRYLPTTIIRRQLLT